MHSGPLLVQPDRRLKRRLDYADLLLKQGSSAEPAPNSLAAAQQRMRTLGKRRKSAVLDGRRLQHRLDRGRAKKVSHISKLGWLAFLDTVRTARYDDVLSIRAAPALMRAA
jgi:hypothetical protein